MEHRLLCHRWFSSFLISHRFGSQAFEALNRLWLCCACALDHSRLRGIGLRRLESLYPPFYSHLNQGMNIENLDLILNFSDS